MGRLTPFWLRNECATAAEIANLPAAPPLPSVTNVLMPTSSPHSFTKGPPLLPGEISAEWAIIAIPPFRWTMVTAPAERTGDGTWPVPLLSRSLSPLSLETIEFGKPAA